MCRTLEHCLVGRVEHAWKKILPVVDCAVLRAVDGRRRIADRRLRGQWRADRQARSHVGRGAKRSRTEVADHVRRAEKAQEDSEESGWFGTAVLIRRL